MWRLVILTVALAGTSCGACTEPSASSDGARAAAPGRGLVLGTTDEPDTLDPLFTEISGAQEIVRLLYRDLADFDEHWRIQPALAAELPRAETSTSGGQRVLWRLRPGLAWSDGAPLTAADVAFGYTIASDPTLETTSREMTAEIARVVARSPLELAVDWRRAYPTYRSPRTHPVLPRHAYPDPKTSPRPFRGMGRAPVSSGPYRLAEWVPGQYIRLEPNPHWSGTKPSLPSITWRFFGAEDAFEVELKTGGIDALGEASGLSIERAAGIAERLAATHEVHYTDSGLWLHMEARVDHPALADVRVRRAISRGIDREQMAKLVYGGRAAPAFGPFPPRHPAHRTPPPEPRDRTLAKRLLEEAGWGSKLELELQFASGSQASEAAATFVQAELAAIGVRAVLSALPLRVLFAKMRDRSQAPLVLFAYRSSPDWDGMAMLHSKGAQNYGGLADPELDRLLGEANAERDPAHWAETLARVEARYREVLPSIPLLFRNAVSVRPKRLEGWRPTGTQTPVTWSAETWRWSD